MRNQDHYRALRKQGVPAYNAILLVRQRQKIMEKIVATGFQWDDSSPFTERHAVWHEQGFRLEAETITDKNGWWTIGEAEYGRFTMTWRPGAIRHAPDGTMQIPWFIPASDDPEEGRRQYKKAASYGDEWWYVVLHVKAVRNGIVLGDAYLGGIELTWSEDNEWILASLAFETAQDAIKEAQYNLKALCSGKAEVAA